MGLHFLPPPFSLILCLSCSTAPSASEISTQALPLVLLSASSYTGCHQVVCSLQSKIAYTPIRYPRTLLPDVLHPNTPYLNSQIRLGLVSNLAQGRYPRHSLNLFLRTYKKHKNQYPFVVRTLYLDTLLNFLL